MLLAASSSIAVAAPAPTIHDAGDPIAPVLLLLLGSPGSAPFVEGPWLEGLGAALEAHTGLVARGPEDLGLDPRELEACLEPRRLSCWVRGALRGTPAPRLLVVAAPPASGGASVSVLLIDLERARSAVTNAEGSDPEAAEGAENQIFLSTIATRERPPPPGDSGGAAALFAGLLLGPWAEVVAGTGRGLPPGALAFTLDRPARLSLDDRGVAELPAGPCLIRPLTAGRRRVVLVVNATDPQAGVEWRADVEIKPGAPTAIEVHFGEPEAPPSELGPVVATGGLGLAALGVAVGVVATIAPPTRTGLGVCRGTECPPASTSFRSLCDLGLGDPSCAGAPSGLRLFPLGAALVAAGATWWLGTEWGQEGGLPWRSLLGGLAAGVALYATLVLLEPG